LTEIRVAARRWNNISPLYGTYLETWEELAYLPCDNWYFLRLVFMLLRLLSLFILIPLCELVLLLYLADVTGWQFTLLLVVTTGVTGTLLARSQGWRTWLRIRQELAAGRMPANSLLDGVLIFVAGALLLTPGILTDLVGISLLIPVCRGYCRRRLVAWFKSRFTVQTAGSGSWSSAQGRSEVIDSYVIEQDSTSERR